MTDKPRHFADQHADRLSQTHPTEVARYKTTVERIESQGLGPDIAPEHVPAVARILAEVKWLESVDKSTVEAVTVIEPKRKTCKSCGHTLDLMTQFYKDGRGGHRAECKLCWREKYGRR